MKLLLILALCCLSLSSCWQYYTCNCLLSGTVKQYTIHEKSYQRALNTCDSYVQGDTCDIIVKK